MRVVLSVCEPFTEEKSNAIIVNVLRGSTFIFRCKGTTNTHSLKTNRVNHSDIVFLTEKTLCYLAV